MKFKRAGEGHRLNESSERRPVPQPARSEPRPPSRQGPTEEQLQAAQAAMARLSTPSKPASARRDPLRDQIRREVELAKSEQASSKADTGPIEVVQDGPRGSAGIRFVCPMVGPETLPKQEMEARIEEYLLEQLGEEPAMAAALIIQTLNKIPSKVKVCVDVLCKYLDNIIEHPQEEKFHRIRANNKNFQEKVISIKGSEEFLQAVGFTMKSQPGPDETAETFFVLDAGYAADTERMRSYKEILLLAEPIRPQLDRGVKVFHPSPKANHVDIPPEFYNISPEELKREMEIRRQVTEKLGMLRTKEMRERDRLRELRRYRFAIIRVRFPDGIILQGTFRATDTLANVKEFIFESLDIDWIPFSLMSQTKQLLDQDTVTITELDLAPASVINFSYNPDVVREVAAQSGNFKIVHYLNPDLLSQIETL